MYLTLATYLHRYIGRGFGVIFRCMQPPVSYVGMYLIKYADFLSLSLIKCMN